MLGSTFAQEYSDDQTAREQQVAPNYARQGYYNPAAYVSILIILQFKFVFK